VPKSPIGVAGIIAPFNSPRYSRCGLWLVPSRPESRRSSSCREYSSNQLHVQQVLAEAADLPHGVVNVFSESGLGGSSLLVESNDVRVISFTGSTKTAKIISAAGAPTLKIFQTDPRGRTPMFLMMPI
jgi:betaine-aldehyde dehydrogenase